MPRLFQSIKSCGRCEPAVKPMILTAPKGKTNHPKPQITPLIYNETIMLQPLPQVKLVFDQIFTRRKDHLGQFGLGHGAGGFSG